MDNSQKNNTNKKMKDYQQYVKDHSPKTNLALQMGKAFLVGGIICCLGQFITNTATDRFSLSAEIAGNWCSVILILISAILTGTHLYGSIVKFGGAGALVPITGFANSVVASAMEYKVEGQVFGIGCKIFTIAGPVILYGVLTSWTLGLLYWIYSLL